MLPVYAGPVGIEPVVLVVSTGLLKFKSINVPAETANGKTTAIPNNNLTKFSQWLYLT